MPDNRVVLVMDEMPETCFDCAACNDGPFYCNALEREIVYWTANKERLKDCPLVPVAEFVERENNGK